MKFKETKVVNTKEILYNDHYVAITYDCSALAAGSDGVIKAGTIVPANDSTAFGVLLSDVVKAENPNGTVVVHGFIKQSVLPTAPTTAAATALAERGIYIMDETGKPQLQKYSVTYDANGGTGTVTDSSSPYSYGATVTVAAGTSLTAPSGSSKTFKGWALTADAAAKDDDYDAGDTFTISKNMELYAVWG